MWRFVKVVVRVTLTVWVLSFLLTCCGFEECEARY